MANKKYKVMHVLRQGGVGGAERLVQTYFRFHDHRRFDVSLGILSSGGIVSEVIAREGFPVHIFNMKNGYDVINAVSLFKYVRKHRIDLVHLHTIHPAGKLFTLLARPKAVIATDHGFTMGSPIKRNPYVVYAGRVLNRFVDHFPAISMGMKNSLIHREKTPTRKITLMYNGIDVDAVFGYGSNPHENIREKLGVAESIPIIGTVGRLSEEKQMHLLLSAFQRLKQKNASFKGIIIGDGPDKDTLIKLCDDLGLNDEVIFTGTVNPAYPYMDIFDIFAMPSGGEAFSITILEAMAKQKPVVAFDVEGVNEAVVPNKTGFLAPFGEIRCFADFLLKLLNEPELGKTLGRNGYDEVCLKYDVKNNLRELETLYTKYL